MSHSKWDDNRAWSSQEWKTDDQVRKRQKIISNVAEDGEQSMIW